MTIPLAALDVLLFIYFIVLVAKTRRALREEYQIPHPGCCVGFVDVLTSVFCMSCSLSQMGRHTAEYKTYRAICCSDTGLPSHIYVEGVMEEQEGYTAMENKANIAKDVV
mmetsp:Transcript_8050/g.9887  ORF Transcript_8050/g.9887 Transcript_8050/m.9887 type:complete len:110 (+) Transcript_8050:1-330(+)